MTRLVLSAALLAGCAAQLDDPPDVSVRCSACTLGATRCDGDSREQVCEDLDGDGCASWGLARACASGACADSACQETCAHACAPGEAVCENGLRRACVVSPDTGCRVLSAAAECGPDQRCDDGLCVDAGAGCSDACAGDQLSECTGEGVRSCGQHDEDPCWEWSATTVCRPGTECQGGICVPTCQSSCADGERQCVGGGVAACGDYDGNGCLELGEPAGCGAGRRCDGGQCVDAAVECEDECEQAGDRECTRAQSAVRTCGQYDGDDCLDLGPRVPCDEDQRCEAGACVEICRDECVADATQCTANGPQTCGEHDLDPCLEWGPVVRCDEDQVCDGGRCVEEEADCRDECAAGDRQCEGPAVSTCGDFDADDCLDWGPAAPCPPTDACDGGECVPALPPGLLINEVFYNPDGDDRAEAFIELWGDPNTPVDGFRLVGVNGSDGEDYVVANLEGVTDNNGYFLIAHPEGDPALRARAQMVHRVADLQNGPDSVQLRWGDMRTDSVGYGEFGGRDHFAGEGDPAALARDGEALTRQRHIDSDDNRRDFESSPPTPGER